MGVFRQFPYSNFHEMNMDEIIKVIKNMLEEWAQYHAQWDEWQGDINQAWQDMQNFINNYFDNLDVQEEINNKIISMVNSGEFAEIVSPYIPENVASWLAENITQPVGVVIDKSLTVAGACADAEATGIKINDVNNELDAFEEMLSDEITISYPDGSHSYVPTDRRVFYPDIIPAYAVLETLEIPNGNIGGSPHCVVEIWELESDGTTLNKVVTKTITDITANGTIVVPLNHYSEKPRYICYYVYDVQTFYRTGQTGEKWYYIQDITNISTLQISSLSTYNNMSLVGDFAYLITNDVIGKIETLELLLTEDIIIDYEDGAHSITPQDRRALWFDSVPANSVLKEIKIPIGTYGVGGYIVVEAWELQDDNSTLNKVFSTKVTDLTANSNVVIDVNVYSDKPRYIGYFSSNVQTFYRTGQTGNKWYYIVDVTNINTMQLSDLSVYNNMSLVGGFIYQVPLQDNDVNTNFFSGWQNGNVVVFGDSTVDGTSTTGHSGNVIGTDRTATDEPNVFTSLLENMLNTFTNGTTRIYNAGFGGKTLNYIVDNYYSIMSAFSDVKSALIIPDTNSAGATREQYETDIRNGLNNLINLLRQDNIAIAIASPQPMFYYPADNTGLPAINNAGVVAIAVNIAKDICEKENIPFIDLGGITNNIMSSPYFKTTDFYGDRLHFGDSGHKFEAYELYGQLIHPVVNLEYFPIFVNLDSDMGELSAVSGISSGNIDGYRSIILDNAHTRTDVLHRIYIIAKTPFAIEGVFINGWASYYDVYVDGVLYTSNTTDRGADITAGCHEITVKPTGTNHVVRYSGLFFESA